MKFKTRFLQALRLLALGLGGLLAGTAGAACVPPGTPVPLLVPNSPIEQRWRELECDTALAAGIGAPLAAARRHLGSGGLVQDFERGQIAAHPSWAGKPGVATPDFVFSAHDTGQSLHVRWSGVPSKGGDFALLRWDLDDHAEAVAKQHETVDALLGLIGGRDPQQIEVEGAGLQGRTDLPAGPTNTHVFVVQACTPGGWFSSADCHSGWSHPVRLDHKFLLLPRPQQLPLPASLPNGAPLLDLADGPMLAASQAVPVFEQQCAQPDDMIDGDGDHEGELKTGKALAVMQAVFDPAITCRRDGAPVPRNELRKLLNDKILAAQVVSVPGTGVGELERVIVGALAGGAAGAALGALYGLLAGPLGPLGGALLGGVIGAIVGAAARGDPGDYDMRLVGLLRIAYRADLPWDAADPSGRLLDANARKHLVETLLTTSGGPDRRRDFLWIGAVPTPIPESENHVLMTETSRYLVNHLRARDLAAAQQPVPKAFDNDQNGMTDWMMSHLQSFVRHDFYETHGRPYAREALEGLSNLYDFAGTVPGGCWRSNPPDPTQAVPGRGCDVRRAARIVLDHQAARFATGSLGLRRSASYRRQPLQRDYTGLMGRQSDSMTWRYLALSGGGEMFWGQRHGRLYPDFAGSLLTPMQGSYRLPMPIAHLMADNDHAWFQRHFHDRDGYIAAEVYARHPRYLISAGGIHDQGRLGAIADTEDAWALPTTLMPARAGLDRSELIRIDGAADEEDRANTCVTTDFACGLNPWLPGGIPEACVLRQGDWTFIDFDQRSPGCDLDFGYFVVLLRKPCDDDDCRSAAGDQGTFGFFAVMPHRVGLQALAQEVLAANGSWDYQSGKANVFRRPDGRTITFQPRPSESTTWGVVAEGLPGAVTNHDLRMRRWPLDQGEVLRSTGTQGCVTIDNPLLDQRLVLDFTDVANPRRTRIPLSTASRLCVCPLPASCLPMRYE